MVTNKPSPNKALQDLIDTHKATSITSVNNMQQVKDEIRKRVSQLWEEVNTPTNNPLMMNQSEKALFPINQLYLHIDKLGNPVYIGNGEPGRAYDCLLRRNHDHALWILDQHLDGYDFVHILQTGLTKIKATNAETTYMKTHNKLLFNKQWKD